MKKRTICIIAVTMTLIFVGLVVLQFVNFFKTSENFSAMFDEAVERSLFQIGLNLEEAEVARYLDATVDEYEKKQSRQSCENFHWHEEYNSDDMISLGDTIDISETLLAPRIQLNKGHGQGSIPTTSSELYEQYKQRFYKSKTLLDRVALLWMKELSDLPIDQRVDFAELDDIVCRTFDDNGIHYPFMYKVINVKNERVYHSYCSYNEDSISISKEEAQELKSYQRSLFSVDEGHVYVIVVSFLNEKPMLNHALRLLLPSVVLIFSLLVVFVVTLVLVSRQTNLTIMKTNFVSNMTHELKTPIASITLASEMLTDDSVKKSPEMVKRMTNVIRGEVKRLKVLVDKVLQLSLYERETMKLNFEEVELNEIVKNAVSSFNLTVENEKGRIFSKIDAVDSWVLADKVHITNIVFNIMENGFKYRKSDETLILIVKTENVGKKWIRFSIQDNGIGMKREHVKHIFEKFYRIPTGNLHDVKGFGLGLAYVKAMVKAHRGKIYVESEEDVGTKFTIDIPAMNND